MIVVAIVVVVWVALTLHHWDNPPHVHIPRRPRTWLAHVTVRPSWLDEADDTVCQAATGCPECGKPTSPYDTVPAFLVDEFCWGHNKPFILGHDFPDPDPPVTLQLQAVSA